MRSRAGHATGSERSGLRRHWGWSRTRLICSSLALTDDLKKPDGSMAGTGASKAWAGSTQTSKVLTVSSAPMFGSADLAGHGERGKRPPSESLQYDLPE